MKEAIVEAGQAGSGRPGILEIVETDVHHRLFENFCDFHGAV